MKILTTTCSRFMFYDKNLHNKNFKKPHARFDTHRNFVWMLLANLSYIFLSFLCIKIIDKIYSQDVI